VNTANLQLEGLCLAIAMINQALVRKGVLSTAEIDSALKTAEVLAAGDREAISSSNHDAMVFPIRLLQQANCSALEDTIPSFSNLARMVGEDKELLLD
jgi:hypothetical protein